MNQLLLNKFFLNKCTAPERALVIAGMLDPSNNSALKLWMQENWDNLGDYDTVNEPDIEKIWFKLHASIQEEIKMKPITTQIVNETTYVLPVTVYKRVILKAVGIAAFLILIIGAYLIITNKKSSTESVYATNNFKKIYNTGKKPKKILLEDGTKVVLSIGAYLIYPTNFQTDKREVTLVGDAIFEVAKNLQKPFFVYTHDVVTKVLGTSFSIQSNENSKDITVSVISGKVQVFEKNDENKNAINNKKLTNNGVLLTPNQKVVYSAAKENFVTSIVASPKPIADTENAKTNFDFDGALLNIILSRIQKMYGIEILLENDNLKKCTFSGDIFEESMYEKLDLICKSINASYEVTGTRILIKGNGCK